MLWPARPQWRGQDHDTASVSRFVYARQRRDSVERARDSRSRAHCAHACRRRTAGRQSRSGFHRAGKSAGLCTLFGIADAVTRSRIPELLEFANLTAKKDARIGELSGGMKRRLTLARALVNDPDLLFMDEPTTGLDPQARHMIWERLKSLLARGKTILLTTHFMDEAERLCDRLAVIDHGKMIAEGSP